MASHELRTPISTIRSSVETLIENIDRTDKKQFQRARRIQRASLEMQYITESLLSLIKQDIEDIYEDSPYELSALLEEITEDHRPLVRNENVSLILKIESREESRIRHDLIKIIVGNLLRNALQSTSRGEVSVTLGNQHISIKDSGYGTPPEIIQWVNDPLTNSLPPNKIGIGLLIVMRLSQQLKLKVSATSQSTGGAEFTLAWQH